MSARRNFSSGAPWEDAVGYSRAVRIGELIEVAGTTAVDQRGEVVGLDDPYLQTRFILEKIGHALEALDASLSDIVRTRIYVTDISRWEEVGRAHGEFFSRIKPAATMVQVAALIDPRLLVEIEVTAVASGE